MQYDNDPTTEAARFEQYLGRLSLAISCSQRHEHLGAYLTGLMLPGGRKSIEPMAAMIEPAGVSRQHQAMHHFVAKSDWSDEALLVAAYDYAIRAMERHGPVEHWAIDDTGLPKRGRHSVGAARQYCGASGKTDLCQVAVSLSVCNERVSLPVGYRLYLPQDWASDPERRTKTGVPDTVVFQEKWKIALDLIDNALVGGKPRATVLADAGYGDVSQFRVALTHRNLPYVVGVRSHTGVWCPGDPALPDTTQRRKAPYQPVTVKGLAETLPPEAFREMTWRTAAAGALTSRFAAMRVQPAFRGETRSQIHAAEWVLIEQTLQPKEPFKYWLSTLPAATPLCELVRQAKERWHVERDYQELKSELGLDHYEGRNWRGFHHHASLCIAAYAFLVAERSRFSPLGLFRGAVSLQVPPVPPGFRRRGAPATRTASTHVYQDPASQYWDSAQPPIAPVSNLSPATARGAKPDTWPS